MSNVIDLLLNADLEQIQRPSKEVEIKRLSNIFGEKFTVLCKALTYDKYSEIQENCIDITTKESTFDLQKLQIELVFNGVFNAQDGTRFFSNKDLHKKNIISPKEAYNLLNSMDKGEKEILLAFIKQEMEIEQEKNSLKEV